jgi:hypothetical protein
VIAFWEDAVGPDHETLCSDDDFVHGFAEGTLDVWDSVKDEL